LHRHAVGQRIDQPCTGARIDDVLLKEYRETIDPQSPNIHAVQPGAAMANGYFAEVGFIADAQSGPAPGPDTVWSAAPGQTLTPSTPVTLTYDNGGPHLHSDHLGR
jgi:YidC/Oxa1 family membrane protein insertase